MAIETNVGPIGTGQEGAVSPNVGKDDAPAHLEGQGESKLDRVANHAAQRGLNRQHREDPTEFTK